MSDLNPFADNRRARVIGPELSRARAARRSDPLTVRTDDRPSGYPRKGSVYAIVLQSIVLIRFPSVFVWPGFLEAVNR